MSREAEGNPRLARTVDEAPTILPTRRVTRIQTPGKQRMRYTELGVAIGSGQFGTVYKCIDVDSGKFMAVKKLHRPTGESGQERMNALRREVKTLAEISHPHIIDYIASQGWKEPQVEIFMGLEEGTLESLIGGGSCLSIANSVFQQMLQALDYLAWKGIVHRDVKPENILYISQPDGQYRFQLADFGLCNRVVNAKTKAGTPLYIAPEMFVREGQTDKVDVWSLFVTMLWVLDAGGFRQQSYLFETHPEVQKAVLLAASNVDTVSTIQEMAVVNPEERTSAAQMLVKHYDGAGLSTLRNRVLALTSSSPSTIATTGALLLAPPSSASGPTQMGRRNLSVNIFAAA